MSAIVDQGSTGACDDCGNEVRALSRVVVTELVAGTPTRVAAYLCGPCARLRDFDALLTFPPPGYARAHELADPINNDPGRPE